MKDKTNTGRQPRGMLVLRTVAMPKDANPNGDIFGGWILAQMDLAGGLMAKQIAGSRTVTVTIDKMVFKRPVHVGDTIGIYAELLGVGNSSMDVQLEVWAKALPEDYAAERHLVTEGLFRYVSIDENRRPRRVPDNPQFFTRSGDTFERQVDDRPGN
jgi:acyl-CoA thioesterase YciA